MELKDKKIFEIASIIKSDWKNVNYAAKPYLDAMFQLETLSDKYGFDSAKSIISYFLGNAQSWRGEVAKEIKKHLNQIIK